MNLVPYLEEEVEELVGFKKRQANLLTNITVLTIGMIH